MRLRAQGPLRPAWWRGCCRTWRRFFSNAPWLLCLCEQLFNDVGHLAPAFGFLVERLQPRLGNGVILCFATVFRRAPGAAGPSPLLPDESGIDGALIEIQCILRDLLESAG